MSTSLSIEKIARILRTDKDTLISVERFLSEISGKENILDKIVEQNESLIKGKMDLLGLSVAQSRDIYAALLSRIQKDDEVLFEMLGQPVCLTAIGCQPILDAAKKVAGVGKGFFLKKEKAEEFILKIPPQNIIRTLGYSSAEEMLKNENLFEIYSALRFVEDGRWLNDTFFKQYEYLGAEDFEEREIETIVLGEKWEAVAEKFLKKKHHNISHLKELGVIFVLPAVLKISGETLRTLALILHYFHEIDFYSKLFRRYAEMPNMSERILKALKGDVSEKRLPLEDVGKSWMIVQRYLAKDDKNDWRLFEPHINPEAIHWKKAENDISDLGGKVDHGIDLSFWRELDWVGNFCPTEAGIDVLVSFNLVDTVMSLVKKQEMTKYLYHHQEALWNKIFSEFMGEEKMEEMILDNFEKGFVDIKS